MTQNGDVQQYLVEKLKIEIHPTRDAAAVAAAESAASSLMQLAKANPEFAMIFATGASQLGTLQALTQTPGLPWGQIRGFHLDEYIGLSPNHPASFRRYLRDNLTRKVKMKEFFEIDGTASDPEQACKDYAALLRAANPQLCLLGIGENGHLAFNDPDVADFNDPLDVKVVQLDTMCRLQQTAEGWFNSLEEVPARAMTITIPALFRVPKLIASVPGPRKAAIIRRTLEDSISTACPATLLRTHPNATLYLDRDSSAQVMDFLRFSTVAGRG
ncbi:MAG TPA: glucosamine-6-phosphate deaminase [Acidobacteriaceae bacterium]|nr:glucosamine-6-phosphate deaminase [Acidobacteriaceae bacterium]